MMAELLIEHAKRAQSEEETPLQAWRKGHRDRALELATDIVFKRDHKLGTLWSLFLAWVAESEGEREWAKRFLDEIRKRWEGAKLAELGGWQGEMAAFLLGELGQVEGATEVAGLVLDDERKGDLAISWASKGLFDQALKVVDEKIGTPWERAAVLNAIAVKMAEAGIFDQALKVATGIKEAGYGAYAWGLREITREMARAGMFDQALKVVDEEIEGERNRAWALSAIAGEMAKAGMGERAKEVLDQALKVAEGIYWDAWGRAETLRGIAEEMAKAGMLGDALKVAEKIQDQGRQTEALRAIAVEMAKAGMGERAKEVFDQALRVALGIEGASQQAMALGAIAAGMAEAGMFEQAWRVAEKVEDKWEQVKALGAIAIEMAKAGMMEGAKEVFDQTLKVKFRKAVDQAVALRKIAGEMAKAGMVERAKEVFEQALKVAEEIGEAWERARALSEIAAGMAEAGMMERAKEVFDQALKVREGIEEEAFWWRAWALGAIVVGMARAGMFEQALKVAKGIDEEFWRAWTLGTLLEIVHGRGEWVIPRSRRAWALWEVAGEMTKAGIKGRAMEVFYQALREAIWRARALKWVAEEMTKAGEVEGMADIVERATGLPTEMLPSILEVLAERASEGDGRSKEGFLRLLPWCGWSLELAYKACGWLAGLYPEQGEAIAKAVRGE
jgi:tetratricopeptide (TPR) repeat protein